MSRKTPWTDDASLRRAPDLGGPYAMPSGVGHDPGWSGHAKAGRAARSHRARRKPWDVAFAARPAEQEREIQKAGATLLALVPEYDRAIEGVERALARADRARAHPRSLANARHARFQLAMSAFHLHALGIYLHEIDRWRPPAGSPDHCVITYVPAIRMSDCLDAYDGRKLPVEREAEFADHPAMRAPRGGRQGNLLPLDEADEDYRAKREIGPVLAHLDARLRRHALQMIRAAAEVMEHHARTPWGWSVYYSTAFTFIWEPVYLGSAVPTMPPGPAGESEPTPDGPTTPRGGRSSGGGPTTGGGRGR